MRTSHPWAAATAATGLLICGSILLVVGFVSGLNGIGMMSGSSDTTAASFLVFPGLAMLAATPYATARLTGSEHPARDAVLAVAAFVPIAPVAGLAPALAIAAGLSVRNDDPRRWALLGTFAVVSAMAAHAAIPATFLLPLLAYPLALLRPSDLFE